MTESRENIIGSNERRLLNWSEIFQYRELFYFFTWRDIKIKYKQTVLGFIWAIIQPLMMMLIFTFFLGRTLNIPSQGLPYPVFVFSGLLIWNIFSTGLSNSANSMLNNSSIIKKIYFPRLIVPVASILVSLFDFLMAFILFIVLLIVFRQPVSLSASWCWPVAIVITFLATLGPSSWLAALNVKYRDFRYVIPFVIQILFFVSPVIYPIGLLNQSWLKYILSASPMYAALEIFRYPLTGNYPDTILIIISLFSCLMFLLIGLLYFRKTEDFFADLA